MEGRRVVGAEYLNDGRCEQVRARREIVLCAGPIGLAELMLSGIGGAGELRAYGIPVVMDLPGVGKNLQDHVGTRGPLDGDDAAVIRIVAGLLHPGTPARMTCS